MEEVVIRCRLFLDNVMYYEKIYFLESPMYLALRAVYCHCVARLDRELLSSEADGVAVVTRDDGDPRNENSSPV